MYRQIPENDLQAIRDRVVISDVVSGYVSLKRSGRGFLGLCPFHNEKTPSFSVDDERGLFHCFGCGSGGTVFSFLMRIENIEFRDAVEILARKAGVQIETQAPLADTGKRDKLFQLNNVAQKYYVDCLVSSAGSFAREYLDRRGVDKKVADRFGIGFCPSKGSPFLEVAGAKPRAVEAAIDLGLFGRRKDGGLYERFFGRITFPIRDGTGKIVGFGGRTLGDGQPKYLNSPESSIFSKKRVLYGLYEAKKFIRENRRIVVVEGYMDVVALAQGGIQNVVASLGTALTGYQLLLAKRFADEIISFFDGDKAGKGAAARAFSTCAETGVWGLGAFLPEGEDPDSFFRSHGLAATRDLLDKAIPLSDFFFDYVDPGEGASLAERTRSIERVAETVASVKDPVKFGLLVRSAAQRFGISESVFRSHRNRRRSVGEAVVLNTDRVDQESYRGEEAMLVETLALDKGIVEIVEGSSVLEHFESSSLVQAANRIIGAWKESGEITVTLDHLPTALMKNIVAAMQGKGPLVGADLKRIATDCISRVNARVRNETAKRIRSHLEEAEAHGDESRLNEQLERSDELIRQLRSTGLS